MNRVARSVSRAIPRSLRRYLRDALIDDNSSSNSNSEGDLGNAILAGGGIPPSRALPAAGSAQQNPLADYFDAVRQGPGIWKWRHYFDAYQRHLAKFVGRSPVVVEVGVFSGGSLPMWKSYFGPGSVIYGIDIEDSCRCYEASDIHIRIGDQSDRSFWRRFFSEVPWVDVLIDDGSHLAPHQIVTLEETLPHISSGGVYLCEDIHGSNNKFAEYVSRVQQSLNEMHLISDEANNERRFVVPTGKFQSRVNSVHFYPYLAVIEANLNPILELTAPKHGTQWQPFLR